MFIRVTLSAFLLVLTGNFGFCQNEWRTIDLAGEQVLDCGFPTPSTGYVITQLGKLWKTTDGGTSWMDTYLFNCQNCILKPYKLFMFSNDVGKVIGEISSANGDTNIVLNTSNGGATWDSVLMVHPYPIWDIDFKSPTKGFAKSTENQGPQSWHNRVRLMATYNGGRTWEVVMLISLVAGADFIFKDSAIGLMTMSTQQPYQASTSRTTNGGKDWTRILDYQYLSLSHARSDHWYGCGNSPVTIFRSTDDGFTWARIGNWQEDSLAGFEKMFFLDEKTGYYNINDPLQDLKNYGYTDDGGNTWKYGRIGDSNDYVSKIVPTTAAKAFAISGKKLFVTTTGGGFATVAPNPDQFRLSITTNPVFASAEFSVSGHREIRLLKVFDAIGRKVGEVSVDPQTTILRFDTSELTPGVYVAQIDTKALRFIKL